MQHMPEPKHAHSKSNFWLLRKDQPHVKPVKVSIKRVYCLTSWQMISIPTTPTKEVTYSNLLYPIQGHVHVQAVHRCWTWNEKLIGTFIIASKSDVVSEVRAPCHVAPQTCMISRTVSPRQGQLFHWVAPTLWLVHLESAPPSADTLS